MTDCGHDHASEADLYLTINKRISDFAHASKEDGTNEKAYESQTHPFSMMTIEAIAELRIAEFTQVGKLVGQEFDLPSSWLDGFLFARQLDAYLAEQAAEV